MLLCIIACNIDFMFDVCRTAANNHGFYLLFLLPFEFWRFLITSLLLFRTLLGRTRRKRPTLTCSSSDWSADTPTTAWWTVATLTLIRQPWPFAGKALETTALFQTMLRKNRSHDQVRWGSSNGSRRSCRTRRSTGRTPPTRSSSSLRARGTGGGWLASMFRGGYPCGACQVSG